MSLEFTRLAQITKDAKYYDAIARITNELQNWQNNTKLPGLWPKSVDASGCKKPEILVPALSPLDHSYQKGPGYYNSQTPQIPSEEIQSAATLDSETSVERTTEHNELEDNSIKSEPDSTPTEEKTESKDKRASSSTTVDEQDHEKRQLSDEDAFTEEQSKPDCEPQGLNSPPGTSLEDFTLGGAADSVFEYLPKEYMLLGGLEKQYQKMYESSMETSKKYLLYRPMIEDEERNVLFSGQISTNGQSGEEQYMKLKTEATHLTCFAGGMFAVGAKIFERSYDMDVARRLTDGCIWAYEMTPTGIMPEHFLVVPCDSETKCPFNKTRWFERLDPYHPRSRTRLSSPQMVLNDPNEDLIAKEKPSKVEESSSASTNTSSVSSPKESSTLVKRQLGDFENDSINPRGSNLDGEKEKKAITIDNEDTESPNPEKNSEDSNHSATTTTGEKESEPIVPMIAAYTPPPIPSQEEYARSRIENEKLPRGVVRITGSKYILR